VLIITMLQFKVDKKLFINMSLSKFSKLFTVIQQN